MIYVLTGLALLLYLAIVFLVGSLLKLHGTGLWALRVGLTLIGIAAAAVCLRYFADTQKKEKETPPDAEPEGDVQFLLREAEAKLATARFDRKADYGSLATVFLIGESGAGKTTAIVRSGLEPELLAGRVEEES